MRRFAFGALLACAAFLTALPALAADVTGVAFVHGTGHQTNAYNDYWQPTMVNNVRGGLANPANYTVINCDFEQLACERGDLVVELFVETPTKLTARQKELMREFAEICGEQQHPKSASFIGKAKQFWEDVTGG